MAILKKIQATSYNQLFVIIFLNLYMYDADENATISQLQELTTSHNAVHNPMETARAGILTFFCFLMHLMSCTQIERKCLRMLVIFGNIDRDNWLFLNKILPLLGM